MLPWTGSAGRLGGELREHRNGLTLRPINDPRLTGLASPRTHRAHHLCIRVSLLAKVPASLQLVYFDHPRVVPDETDGGADDARVTAAECPAVMPVAHSSQPIQSAIFSKRPNNFVKRT
jgi:hypothetical protein